MRISARCLPQTCHTAKRLPNGSRRLMIKTGRDDWIRTSDLTHPKRARYQAAPRPVSLNLTILPNSKCQTAALTTRRLLLGAALRFLLEERQQIAQLCGDLF